MTKTILIITNGVEETPNLVISELLRMNERFVRVNIENFPITTSLCMSHSKTGCVARIKTDSDELDSSEIKSVWYWKPAPPNLPQFFDDGITKFVRNEVATSLWSFYTTLKARWVNPPLVGTKLLEDNKLFQLEFASKIGLNVPETIITNDPDEVTRFAERHSGVVVLKPLYTSCIVSSSDELFLIYTRKLTTKEIRGEADTIRSCPVFVQQYIPKKLELRITVVGAQVFSCAIYSQERNESACDWRHSDIASLRHETFQLPANVEDKVKKLVNTLGLVYGAIDMIVTPSDEFFFLEINPNGQWLWIEQITGQKLSRAIASELANI